MTPRLQTVHAVILAVLAVILNTAVSQDVVRIVMPVRLDSYNQPSKVTLLCAGGTGSATFWRRVDVSSPGQRLELSVPGSDRNEITFIVTPSVEGLYYCKSGNVTSVNHLEIVAFPLQNPTIAAIKKYTVDIGQNGTLSCVYDTPGALKHRYNVDWFVGQEIVVNASIPVDSRYSVSNEDFSLTIQSATTQDSSKVYYCALRVVNVEASSDFYRLGPTTQLEVEGPLEVTEDIDDVITNDNSHAEVKFTCTVSGSPEPGVIWTLQGKTIVESDKFIVDPSIDTQLSAIRVTSHLTIKHWGVQDSGYVECIGVGDSKSSVITSRARLVVLPSDFEVEIQALVDGSALLLVDLPTRIPGAFSIVVRYIQSALSSYDVELFDIQFADTSKIEYSIPLNKLPPFTTFRVRVALRVGEVQGGFSVHSNIISVSGRYDLSTATGSQCEQKSGSDDDSPVVWVLIAIAVVVTLVLCFVIVAFVIYCSRNLKVASSPSNYTDGEGSDRVSRSPSRCSYKEASLSLADMESINSQKLADKAAQRKEIGGMDIVDMSHEDLFSTLSRPHRPHTDDDPEIHSSDFAIQVPSCS